jgi:hypothetical protein
MELFLLSEVQRKNLERGNQLLTLARNGGVRFMESDLVQYRAAYEWHCRRSFKKMLGSAVGLIIGSIPFFYEMVEKDLAPGPRSNAGGLFGFIGSIFLFAAYGLLVWAFKKRSKALKYEPILDALEADLRKSA